MTEGTKTDKELIQEYLSGDHDAFEELVKRYQAPISRLCYSILKNETRVSDVVQDVFLSAFQGLQNFRGDSSFKTWLYKVAVHEALRYLKKNDRWNSLISDLSSAPSIYHLAILVANKHDSPEKSFFSSEQRAMIEAGMNQLSHNHHMVLNFHYSDGLSVEEIAEILDIPVGSVKSRLHYARLRLRELLSPLFNPSQDSESNNAM